jgi:hypothetical protein
MPGDVAATDRPTIFRPEAETPERSLTLMHSSSVSQRMPGA